MQNNQGETPDSRPTQPQATFIKQETIHKEKWLSLERVTYKDPTGRQRTWESVERTTKPNVHGSADAVAMVTVLKRLIHYDCIVLVKQFRPALKCNTIEFPAGLIDQGESPKDAAIRELKEETGYTGTILSVSPALALDSGISATSINLVHMQVDGDDPDNLKPSPNLDDGESIEVLLLPFHKLRKKLDEMAGADLVIDARVYTYASAIEQYDWSVKK
ncbi:ADP-sugar pyrophosphatase-like isoform X2 [Amphiura filiformis]